MPFIEVIAPPLPEPRRQQVARGISDGICAAFGVGPQTVTSYFIEVPPSHCAHAGALGETQRLFIKVHAYRRGIAARRAAATVLTSVLAAGYGVPAKALAVYFLDREKDEVAHAGALSSDTVAA